VYANANIPVPQDNLGSISTFYRPSLVYKYRHTPSLVSSYMATYMSTTVLTQLLWISFH